MVRVGLLSPLLAILMLTVSFGADAAQEKVAAALEKLGGKILRNDKEKTRPILVVDLRESKITNADLQQVATLTDVMNLDLSKTKITDAGLKSLVPLSSLQSLTVDNTEIGDDGLKTAARAEA